MHVNNDSLKNTEEWKKETIPSRKNYQILKDRFFLESISNRMSELHKFFHDRHFFP